MVIISSIKPANLNIDVKINFKYDQYIIYESEFGFFVHILEADDVQIWKSSVRYFLDQEQTHFLFIGKGEKLVAKPAIGCVVKGQVNLSGENPLIGKNDEQYGPRFFDVGDLYSDNMRKAIFKPSDDFIYGNILIPQNKSQLTDLEKKILKLDGIEFIASSRDIYAGALTAKHGQAESAGVILFEDEFDLKKIVKLPHD